MENNKDVKEALRKAAIADKSNKFPIPTEEKKTPVLRRIVIETDGNNISIPTIEVYGLIELEGIFDTVLKYLKSNTPAPIKK